MRIKNIALAGIGKFGKKYYNEIKINNNYNISCIFKKKPKQSKIKFVPVKKFNNKIKLKGVDGAVIVTPLKSHFSNAIFFLSRNIPIILEKPATESIDQINELIRISKKKKVAVLVHHSDLYNENFIELKKRKKNIGKIKKIMINILSYQSHYKEHGINPLEDWLPHILAMLNSFINIKGYFKIKIKNKIIDKRSIFLNLSLLFENKFKQKAVINFCNFNKKRERSIKIIGSKGYIKYDGYNINKNCIYYKNKKYYFYNKKTTISNILNKFNKMLNDNLYVNDLNLSKKILLTTNKIKKLF